MWKTVALVALWGLACGGAGEAVAVDGGPMGCPPAHGYYDPCAPQARCQAAALAVIDRAKECGAWSSGGGDRLANAITWMTGEALCLNDAALHESNVDKFTQAQRDMVYSVCLPWIRTLECDRLSRAMDGKPAEGDKPEQACMWMSGQT